MFEGGELAEGVVEGLVAYCFADEAEVEDAEVGAFGEAGPAVYGEGGLGGDEDFEGGLGAAEEAGGGGFCALVDDVGEVEGVDEAGEGGPLDAGDDGGADCADEEGVGVADEVGGGVEDGDAYVVPLSGGG